jgi:hypothetical protein
MRKLEEYYVAFWCLTMPITSFLIIPVVQGTIFAYMLAFGSLGLVLLKVNAGHVSQQVISYFKMFALVFMLWIVLLCGSQLADMVNPQVNIQDMFAISDETAMLFRSSLFSQSLYFFACVMIALYFRYFFPEAWMKYVYWGAWFLVIYGLYDWTFFLVFHQSGDFIANRTFGQGDHPGSWSQTLDIGGLQLLRLKSSLGEPSFFSAVVIPYLFMALDGRKRLLAALLFGCAILSTSTTVYAGLVACFFLQALWTNKSRRASVMILGLVVLAIIAMSLLFPDTFRFLFLDKVSGDTESGRDRLKAIEDFKMLFGEFGLLNWIFGIGFGYLYFSLLWSITANTGLIGIGTFLFAFLKPAIQLPREPKSEWLKISMVAILVVVAITLSEFFLPTTWMFLGLAYRRLDQLARERALGSNLRPLAEDVTPELSLTDSHG